MYNIPNNKDVDNSIKDKIFESFIFWESKRFLFNLLVGITGLFVWIFLLYYHFLPLNILVIGGVIIWAIFANALYSVGYIAESYIVYYSKARIDFSKFRLIFFFAGTISYMLFTLLYGYMATVYPFLIE